MDSSLDIMIKSAELAFSAQLVLDEINQASRKLAAIEERLNDLHVRLRRAEASVRRSDIRYLSRQIEWLIQTGLFYQSYIERKTKEFHQLEEERELRYNSIVC